jgi:hypothetical protein
MGLTILLATAALAAAPTPHAPFPAPAIETPVQIGRGPGELYGSLLRPVGAAAPGAVLMIGGSGPGDRNGDDLPDRERSQTMRLLALALVDRGVISLRYDKRGFGESAPAGEATSVDQLTDDAVRWARFLTRQPGVGCVVVLGHSEGALIGALVAQKIHLCGLIEVSGASQDLGDLIETQGSELGRSPELSAQIHQAIQAERSGRPIAVIPKGYDSLFGPKAEPFTRSEIAIDPVAELSRVGVPVLVVQGDNDLQVKVGDAQRLAAAAHVQPVIVPGMNHVLKLAPTSVMGNFLTYADPARPLAPGVAEAIGDFVLARR